MKAIEEGPIRYTYYGIPNWRDYTDWEIYRNKAWRPAVLLAVNGSEFLFEYESANTKMLLVEIGLNTVGEFDWYSINSVRRIPLKWRLAEWLNS